MLLQGCATSMKPKSSYRPPPGVMLDSSDLDTGYLEPTPGHKGDRLGAEVVTSEITGEERVVNIRVPVDPDRVDKVQLMSTSGQPLNMSREAQIVHNYETNNVGITVRIPNSDNMGFRLKLIDETDTGWPTMRQQ